MEEFKAGCEAASSAIRAEKLSILDKKNDGALSLDLLSP